MWPQRGAATGGRYGELQRAPPHRRSPAAMPPPPPRLALPSHAWSADIAAPGLVRVSVGAGNTSIVQLHLGQLALAGGDAAAAAAAAGGGSAAFAPTAPPAAQQRAQKQQAAKGPATQQAQQTQQQQAQYRRCEEPTRHLLVCGLGGRDDVLPVLALARRHGRVQASRPPTAPVSNCLRRRGGVWAAGLARRHRWGA